MSGSYTLPSAFSDPNILYKGVSGAGLIENQNALYQGQEAQQRIGSAETEMMARAAGTLMDPTLYPTTEARAAAYPGLVPRLARASRRTRRPISRRCADRSGCAAGYAEPDAGRMGLQPRC